MVTDLEEGTEPVTNKFKPASEGGLTVLYSRMKIWIFKLHIILWGQIYSIMLFVNEGIPKVLGYIPLECHICAANQNVKLW